MADDAKAEEMLDQLRQVFTQQIRSVLNELPPHLALQLADALCQQQLTVLAGLRVTYAAKPKIDGEAVAEDWRRGLLIGEIMRKHKISRSAAYKFHPGKTAREVSGDRTDQP